MINSPTTQKFLKQHSDSTEKTEETLELLEQELNNTDVIFEDLNRELDKSEVSTEENLRENFKEFRKQLTNISEIYSKFLTKYDLERLVRVSIECLNKKIPWLSIREQLCRTAVREFLKTIDLSEASDFLNLLDGTLKGIESFAFAILPLKSKRPPISTTLDNFVDKLEKTIDISSFCDVLSGNIADFEKFFKLPDIINKEFQDFKNKLPEYPTFEFPDNLETIDLIQNVQELSEKTIQDQVLRFLTSTVGIILSQVIEDNCLDDSQNLPIQNFSKKEDIQKQIQSRYGNNSRELSEFAETVSMVLSAQELCGLLRGRSNQEIIDLIEFLVEKKFPSLKSILKDEENIQDFFILLSNAVDLGICEDVVNSGGNFGPCLEREVNEFRDCILKKEGIKIQEIEALLRKIKDRHLKTLQKLFDILSGTPDNEFDFSRICEIDIDTEIVSKIEKNYEQTATSIIDGVLRTVGVSYDQALTSYVRKLIKEVTIPVEKEIEFLPNLTNKVIDTAKQSYNDVYKKGLSSFRSEQDELQRIVDETTNGNVAINSLMDIKNVESIAKGQNFLANKKKRVQPDLKNRLSDGSFVDIRNQQLIFTFPKKETSEANKFFEGKISSTLLPVDTDEIFTVENYLQVDSGGDVYETLNAKHITSEKRIKRDSFMFGGESDCQIVKVYLPICFGLATYKRLWDVGLENSQPLFPNYKDVFSVYYPQYTELPFDNETLLPSGPFKKQASELYSKMIRFISSNLSAKNNKRLFSHGIDNLSDARTYPLGNFSRKLSERELYLAFFDVFGVRNIITNELKEKMWFLMEKYWLENIWQKLNVAYHYRIHNTGEAFLVKIDLNERILTTVEDSEFYGGPKTNIEDIISYNTVSMRQKNWINHILHGDFSAINSKLKTFNPFSPMSLLRKPNPSENESRNNNSKFERGVIEYEYGIPANEKARTVSWYRKDGWEVERFNKENSLLPSYLGDFVRMSSRIDEKQSAIRQNSSEIQNINKNKKFYKELIGDFDNKEEFPTSYNNKTGQLLVEKSAIPTFSNIPKEYRITNILNIGNNPLETLKKQDSYRLNFGANEVNHSFNEIAEKYESTKQINKKIPKKYFEGVKNDSTKGIEGNTGWIVQENINVDKSLLQKSATNSNNYDIRGNLWANVLIESLKGEFSLSGVDKKNIHKFYNEQGGFLSIYRDFVSKFSRFVATSPLFQSIETTNVEKRKFTIDDRPVGQPQEGLLETNIMELVNFSPKLDLNTLRCGVDLDLMRLNQIRREIIQTQKKLVSCLGETDQIENINKILLTGLVKILVRLYVVEYVLSSVFFFSRFDFSFFEVKDIVSKYIANNVIQGIDFKKDFYEIVASIYLEEFKIQNTPIDCQFALEQIVKNQLRLVSSRLKNILYTPTAISKQKFDIAAIFQDYITSYVKLPKRNIVYEQGRFVPTNKEGMTDLQVEDYLRNFVGSEDIRKRAEQYDINSSGFFLEKYVKPKWKLKYQPPESVLDGIVGMEAFNERLNQIVESPKDRITKYLDTLHVGMRLVYRPNPNSKEHEFLRGFINRKYKSVNFSTKTFFEPGKPVSTSPFYYLKQVVIGDRIIGGGLGRQRFRVELYWKIDTKKDRQKIVKMLRGSKWDFSKLTNKNPRRSKIFIVIDNKTQRTFEDFNKNGQYADVLDLIENDLYTSTNNPGLLSEFRFGSVSTPQELPTEFRESSIVGQSILIPIQQVESEIDVSKEFLEFSEEQKIITRLRSNEVDPTCKKKISVVEKEDTQLFVQFDKEYDTCYEQNFRRQIYSSEQWRLIRDNIIDATNIANILSLYISFYNQSTTDIGPMFDSTKNNLLNLFENIENIDNLFYLQNSVGSFPLYNNNIDTRNLNPQESRFFDLDSIRNSTPYVMLKGLMETFDPNIAISKRVVDLANNYKRNIIRSARRFTPSELSENAVAQSLVELARELEQTPDLPVHIPSLFFMIAGVVPSPLGFAYLGFEAILGNDLLESIQNNLLLKQKIESETGVSLDAAREFAKLVDKDCKEE